MSTDRKALLAAQSVVLTMVVIILIVAACTGQQGSSSNTGSAPSQVEVIEKEFMIEPQVSTVTSGEVTFVIKNEGFVEHNFVVEGIDKQVELILPQESGTLTVNLSPGTYDLVCNLPGHKEAGMVSEITVE